MPTLPTLPSGSAADPLLRANDALREALRQFESPEAKLLPPAQYSALERRVLDLSRVVERLVLGPGARTERWVRQPATSGGPGAESHAAPPASSRN
jgi:hypothetical protein